MTAHFPALPPVVAPLEPLLPLEDIGSKYNFVFQLDEAQEPVDPIIAAIRSSERVRNLPSRSWLPQESKPDALPEHGAENESLTDLWERAHTAPPVVRKNELLTWDALRWPELRDPTPPVLVSELATSDFDAVLYHVAGSIETQHSVTASRIVHHLPALLTGCSSELFVWDEAREAFLIEDNGYRIEHLRIEGLDTNTSHSLLNRFLNTGTLLRRLESMIDAMRISKQQPTFHEFLHGLDAALTYLKISLGAAHPYASNNLASIWFHYQEPAEILEAVAQLCNRDVTKSPPYPPLPPSDVDLLSHLYNPLLLHTHSSAPKPVRAICAYILQSASRSYIARLEERVGLSKRPLVTDTETLKPSSGESALDLAGADAEQDDVDVSSSDSGGAEVFAAFVPPDLSTAIPLARRSLHILLSAKVDFSPSDETAHCRWLWTDEAKECEEVPASNTPTLTWAIKADLPLPAPTDTTPYPPPLAAMRVFDMEPGSHAFTASVNGVSFSMSQLPRELVNFIASFPDTFSPATPNLEHIAARSLQPLLDHSRMLSLRLLSLFLESSDLHGHLTIMRDYLLMTGHSFKSHLVAAVFTDSYSLQSAPAGGILQFRRRTVHRSEQAPEDDSKVHGVALKLGGYGTAHSDWPPGAADISFSLRRVIVDALDDSESARARDDGADIWRQVETRLGFGLREIPDSAVTEGWFNPDRLEALDFLYLVYRPPHPLDQVVLSSEIMLKYQRVFAFLLRLLRIEEVCRIIHQCANSRAHTTDTPVFVLLPPTRKLLSRFCFQVQAFITALSSYVFDVAIGKRFDRLLANVANLRTHISTSDDRDGGLDTAMDVFALADYHSAVLDQILAGCLLRSKQATAGDALRDCMTAVLDFGRLVVRVTNRDLADILGAQELEDVHGRFEDSMTRLVSVLRALSEKSRSKAKDSSMDGEWRRRHGFVVDPQDLHSDMSQLLMRLDGSGWWRRTGDKASNSHDTQ